MKKLLLLGMALWTMNPGWGEMRSTITHYEITWTFDKAYETGRFANGDWWVVGPVTITRITPDFQDYDYWDFTTSKEKGVVIKKINGWQVNPTARGKQGFDEANYEFDASLVPALPYAASPGQSIVKAICDTDPANMDSRSHYNPDSRTLGHCRLLTAAVLTVVDAIPPDSGRTVFRPPYVDTDKPYYSVNGLRTDLLPSLPIVPLAPTLEWVETNFGRVQVEHMGGNGSTVPGAFLKPRLNMTSAYQPHNAVRNMKGALRLLHDDPLPDRMKGLIAFVQYGIDMYHFVLSGQTWCCGGYGVQPGHKLPLVLAATLLDHADMKKVAGEKDFFLENRGITLSSTGNAIWGGRDDYAHDQEFSYWDYIIKGTGVRTGNANDPYGYIDQTMTRTEFSEAYQLCCLSHPYKGEGLVALLIPGMKDVWNDPGFFQYIDRWVNHGLLTQPDPCAPAVGTWLGGPDDGKPCTSAGDTAIGDAQQCVADRSQYGVTYGPDPKRPGDCIRDTDPSDGTGRFPTRDGVHKDGRGGGYESKYVDFMWKTYRPAVPVAAPAILPAGGAYAGVVDVSLARDLSSWRPLIRYTTDGTDPDTSSPLYTAPVRLQASTVVKARAFFGDYAPSAVVQASYTITTDTQGPRILQVVPSPDSDQVTVCFDEPVDPVTAGQPGNYTLDRGVSVSGAVVTSDGKSVILTCSTLQPGTGYTVTVNNVKDVSGNVIAANAHQAFTYTGFNPLVGLKAFWTFDNDQGNIIYDQSYKQNNGTVTGATWTEGLRGQGLSFTSADEAVIGSGTQNFGIDASNEFTFAFWMKLPAQGTFAGKVLSRRVPLDILVTASGNVSVTMRNNGSSTSSTSLAKGAWQYVVLTYKDPDLKLYINGAEDAGGSRSVSVDLYWPNTDQLKLGAGFTGVLDEVRIYNKALTAIDIAALYADTAASSCQGIRESLPGPGRTSSPAPVNGFRLDPRYTSFYRLFDMQGSQVPYAAAGRTGVYILQVKGTGKLIKVVVFK